MLIRICICVCACGGDVGVIAFFQSISEYYCTVAYIRLQASSPKGDDDLHVWFATSAVSLTLLQGLLGLVLRLALTQTILMPLMANHERPNSRFSVKPLRNTVVVLLRLGSGVG